MSSSSAARFEEEIDQDKPQPVKPASCPTADTLENMARTFRQRNAVYGNNYEMVGELMTVLHGKDAGDLQQSSEDHVVFHLWSLMIVKLSRFAISGLSHQDSIHDLAVYAAMIETILKERTELK